MMFVVTCEKELGTWTIRVNGRYVGEFWGEAKARRFAMSLADALVPR